MQEGLANLFAKTPVLALQPSTLESLANNLDADRIATQRNGLLRNWRGLVELIGYGYLLFENEDYPTKKVLERWQREAESTIGKLIEHLEQMGRYDAIDDAWEFFIRDAEIYTKRLKTKFGNENYERSLLSISSTQSNTSIRSNDSVFYSINGDYLTTSDTTENLAYFDAFVCYTAVDKDFVNDLIINVEKVRKLKLCIPDRDILPGVVELLANVELIKNRCRRMIIVLSPEFLCSQEHSFLTTLVQAISVDDRKRIIVPVIYKPCHLPPTLHALSKLDYTRGDMFKCFWDRLIDSLRLDDEPTRSSSSLSISSNSPSPSSVSTTPPTFRSGSIAPYRDTNLIFPLPSGSSGYSSFSVQQSTEGNNSPDICINNLNQDSNHIYNSEHEQESEQQLSVLRSNDLSSSLNHIVINDNSRKNSKSGRSPKIKRFKDTFKKLITR